MHFLRDFGNRGEASSNGVTYLAGQGERGSDERWRQI